MPKKMTKEEFIQKANEEHGEGTYDYIKVDYVRSSDKITIICPEHGEFEQLAKTHLKGSGCRECGIEQSRLKRLSNIKEFIASANKEHGEGTYNYSKVEYDGNKKKVTIICPEHDEFTQTPNNHLNGVGCPVCAGNIQLTTETFIKSAIIKHGEGTYDYSKVEYVHAHKKVTITCPKHGDFTQKPGSHLFRSGCRECGIEKAALSRSSTTDTFIKDAIEIHGECTYDYSKVVYVKSKEKVTIICPEHDEFTQQPGSHLQGQGCPHCVGTAPLTNKTFIERANKKHGECTYDYSKVEYRRNKDKVIIGCSIEGHGDFEQAPSSHLQGNGCPHCAGVAQLNTEIFIKRAIEEHGKGTYDYSKVLYVRTMDKVTIICKKHGNFEQAAHSHLKGIGCDQCGGSAQLTTETFIQKAKEIHGTIYDYTKVEYVRSNEKVTIICSIEEHSDFEQTPNSHLQGQGCPHCKADVSQYLSFILMMNDPNGVASALKSCAYIVYLKLLEVNGLHFTKIGITKYKRTFKSHVIVHDSRDLVTLKNKALALLLEYLNHRHNEEFNMLPVFNEENIEFGGRTECFSEIKGVFLKITKARIMKYVPVKYHAVIFNEIWV